jgi:nucleoside-diphosphate kinase
MKTRKLFLKKIRYPALSVHDFYIGSVVNVNARQMKIIDFGNQHTKNIYSQGMETTLAMIKPDGIKNMGEIIDIIYSEGFRIAKMRMVQLSQKEAQQFYAVHEGKPFFHSLVEYMSSDKIVALELVSNDAVAKWRAVIGPTNCEDAKRDAPNSIRARFGTDKTRNAVHGSDSRDNAIIESNFFFGKSIDLQEPATFSNCTLGIIKPHAVSAGVAGEIIQRIQKEGFEISAMRMFNVDSTNSADFYEVYKGVVPEFQGMVESLTIGSCIAIEIKSDNNVVDRFRALCGPSDPELARVLRPNTIRALYGDNKIENAIHCTDLEDDGVLEVEFFFKILVGTA